jgi:DNA-binding response OmpR family regulator
VLEADNGERGLVLAFDEAPDVIVLDLMLPLKDGFAVLSELLADPRTLGTPVILLTAKTQVEDRLAGWRAGCAGYVTKPFSPIALTELVDRVAEMPDDERRQRREQELERLAQHD